MRTILLAITALSLAGCHGSANSVLSQLTIAAVGHDAPFVTADEPPEDIPVPPVEPVVEPPVYVPPPTEACLPGEFQFRVWACGPDGHRAYI